MDGYVDALSRSLTFPPQQRPYPPHGKVLFHHRSLIASEAAATTSLTFRTFGSSAAFVSRKCANASFFSAVSGGKAVVDMGWPWKKSGMKTAALLAVESMSQPCIVCGIAPKMS